MPTAIRPYNPSNAFEYFRVTRVDALTFDVIAYYPRTYGLLTAWLAQQGVSTPAKWGTSSEWGRLVFEEVEAAEAFMSEFYWR